MSFLRFITRPPVDVYPLLAAVTVACGYGIALSYKNLAYSQDIIIDKTQRDSWEDPNRYSLPAYWFFLGKGSNLPTKVDGMRKQEIKYES